MEGEEEEEHIAFPFSSSVDVSLTFCFLRFIPNKIPPLEGIIPDIIGTLTGLIDLYIAPFPALPSTSSSSSSSSSSFVFLLSSRFLTPLLLLLLLIPDSSSS